jgi:hypothetical protein
MSFEDWYKQTETGQRKLAAEEKRKETLWERVSKQAKERKLLNKKSKRDIEREARIAQLGGTPIVVEYGFPLQDRERLKRIELETDLKWPNRKQTQEVRVQKRREKLKQLRSPTGSKRNIEQLIKSCLRTARKRSEEYKVPFDIIFEDLEIPTHCPIFGWKFKWGTRITNETPSLDRVVPELGYVKGNVRVICMRANRLKNNASIAELEKVLEYMKGHR